MKKLFYMQINIHPRRVTFLFILIFSTLMVHGQKNVIDQVVAVVGDEPVLRSDIEFQHQQALMEGVDFAGDMKCHILENLYADIEV